VHANRGRIIVINTHTSKGSHLASVELIGPAGDMVPQLFDGIELNPDQQ
jgi:hypothetical protein